MTLPGPLVPRKTQEDPGRQLLVTVVKMDSQMKISKTSRVEYEHNPLAEVVCQVRFVQTAAFQKNLPEALVACLVADGFVVASQEQAFSIELAMGPVGQQGTAAPQQVPTSHVFHHSTEDGIWKASVAADFCAITCTKYQDWEQFYPHVVSLCERGRFQA